MNNKPYSETDSGLYQKFRRILEDHKPAELKLFLGRSDSESLSPEKLLNQAAELMCSRYHRAMAERTIDQVLDEGILIRSPER